MYVCIYIYILLITVCPNNLDPLCTTVRPLYKPKSPMEPEDGLLKRMNSQDPYIRFRSFGRLGTLHLEPLNTQTPEPLALNP